jgi:atypical dual specificity phosphatase
LKKRAGVYMPQPAGFYWIERPLVAGMARPEDVEDLEWLRRQGLQLLLSLTEEPPRRDWLETAGLLLFHVPVEDMAAPTLEQFDLCMSVIDKALAQNMGVAVHCGAGLGRTGTVLAAYLVHCGSSAAEAIRRVRSLRPGSVETPEQAEAIAEFARRKDRSSDESREDDA